MGQSKLLLLAGTALSLTGVPALAQSSTDEVRAVVAEMLSDAETRSSLLAGGDAGHDGKFFIAGDGFRLNVGGAVQFRYNLNFRDNDAANGSGKFRDDFTHGFQLRRAAIDLDGQLNKDWFFRVRGLRQDNGVDVSGSGSGGSSTQFSSSGFSSGSFDVDYAYAGYKFANGGKLTFGQFRSALLREELVSDYKQLASERSLANALFTSGFSQGLEYSFEADAFRFFVGFSDGQNSANTDFNARQNVSASSSGGTAALTNSGQAEYAFNGRIEFLASGNFAQFEDFTGRKGEDFGLLFGAAANWQQSDNTDLTTDIDRNALNYTADVSAKGDSWNAFGAFLGRWIEDRNGGAKNTYNDFGVVGQAGWRFAENTELFGRYDGIFLDKDWGIRKNYHFATFGLNQYYAGHAAKATLDAVWSFNRTDGLASRGLLSDTAVGLLGSDKKNEVTVRLQFQLLF